MISSDGGDGAFFEAVRMSGQDDINLDNFVVHGGHSDPNDDEGEEHESPIFSTNAEKLALNMVCRGIWIAG